MELISNPPCGGAVASSEAGNSDRRAFRNHSYCRLLAVRLAEAVFSIVNGELVHHNFSVPSSRRQTARESNFKDLLGHVLVIQPFMTAFFSDYWYSSESTDFTR